MHILLVGNHRSDRSGLIRSLLKTCPAELPVQGYVTEKREPDGMGRCPIYLHPIQGERRYGQENLIGWCKDQRSTARPEGFEGYAPVLEELPYQGIIVLDELGVMESDAPRFRRAVLAVLDGALLVVASVRDKDTPFLRQVRGHPRCQCFSVEEGREEACLPAMTETFRQAICATGVCGDGK